MKKYALGGFAGGVVGWLFCRSGWGPNTWEFWVGVIGFGIVFCLLWAWADG